MPPDPTRHYFTDHLGNQISIRDICNFYDRSYETIYDQYKRHNMRTLTEIAAYCKSGSNGRQRHYKTIKGHLTCREVADQSGTSTATVRGRGIKYGWDSEVIFWPDLTREEFNARLKAAGLYVNPIYNKIGKKTNKVFFNDDDGTKITPGRAAHLVGQSQSSMYHYYHKCKCRTMSDVYARKKYLQRKEEGISEKWVVPSSVDYVKPIHRSKMCFSYDCHGIIYQECRHYSSCTDTVAFEGVNHKRYRPDGSCFVGTRLEFERAGDMSGEATDRVVAISY